MKKLLLLFLFMSIGILSVFAQYQVSGTVISSADKQAVIGATVRIKGTTKGIATDESGNFTINYTSANAILVISNIGYENQDVSIDGKKQIIIELHPTTTGLGEVVVIGYGTQRKKDLTGAVSIVQMDNLKSQPSGQIAIQLQGQASGVTVISSGQPGDVPQIRIRGINTFGNNTPLFVVDGVPTQNISDLNSNDIASIQVLKDAGAASIYGSRASNGVMIITTKAGKGKVAIHYDGYYGSQVPRGGNIFHVLDPQENANLKWLALKNSGATSYNDALYGNGSTPVLPDYISPVGAKEGDPLVDPGAYLLNPDFASIDEFRTFHQITKANKQGTDWFHEIFKPAPMTSHNLSVSGGDEKGDYFLSLNNFNQKGMLTNTFLNRYSIRANSKFNFSKNISIGENLEFSISSNRGTANTGDDNPIYNAATMPRIIPVYDIAGNFGGAHGTDMFGYNPVAHQYRMRNNKKTDNRILGNLYADIKFLKYFTFHTSFGGDNHTGLSHSFAYPVYEGYLPSYTNSYSEGSYSGYNWTWTNTLAFRKNFNTVHDVSVLLGTEAFDAEDENLGGSTQDYFSFDPNYTTLSSGSGAVTNYSSRSTEGLFSQFGRIDYSYKSKYLLGATIRRDGSSKFINEQYGWFPAASVGWRISQENFFKNISWITDLKIRGSWGVMGNQLNVNATNGYYTYIGNKNSSYYDLSGTNNSIEQGFQVGQIGNPDAKWEKDVNSNIGLDANFFNGKIQLTADYYYKDINDLLYNPSVLGTRGSGTVPFINIAGVTNRGLDFSLSGNFDISHDLHFDASLTFTTYDNKISKVTDNTNYFWTNDQRRFGTNFIRNEVGHPIGSFYGYKIVGFWDDQTEIQKADAEAQKTTQSTTAIFQPDEGVGRFRYADVNGDGHITTDDRTFLGNPNPKFSSGLNLGLTYKGFDFSVFLYGVYGNQVWNQLKWWTDFYSSFNTAKSQTALYDSWRPDHQNAKVAIQENNGFASTNGSPNSYYVEDGSYIRAKNIQLGYTLPSGLLKSINVQKLRVYFQATNLFTITKYSGLDPEISGSVTDFGVDEGGYPYQHGYLVGINLNF
jgi:TonB-linked SusC/RagA family outer membrane protein